ncbi:hypothetical protein Ddye_025670 [Dipteronia dyeriana]|uniref:Uncharacterized protein n=1 Tax=Dipteronia dyeriana TaxID=168575 RepID=A0AAD9WPT8_9ROSI|nr:hypothetical protein Ddye_025670 [Dipteronia dyeriana]
MRSIYVKVISREIIKPTTPPQDHHIFSFLYQFSPTWYLPLIYFVSLDLKPSKNEISNNLKTSLSQVLNHYYPLVGIVNDNFIDCKNGGVLLDLLKFLQNPNPTKFINKFQVNSFNCGGIAIGACMSHKVTYASTMITFIKNWVETAQGNIDNVCPKIVGTTLFMPKDGVDGSFRHPTEMNIMSKCNHRAPRNRSVSIGAPERPSERAKNTCRNEACNSILKLSLSYRICRFFRESP